MLVAIPVMAGRPVGRIRSRAVKSYSTERAEPVERGTLFYSFVRISSAPDAVTPLQQHLRICRVIVVPSIHFPGRRTVMPVSLREDMCTRISHLRSSTTVFSFFAFVLFENRALRVSDLTDRIFIEITRVRPLLCARVSYVGQIIAILINTVTEAAMARFSLVY